jgi:hypothetical protein
MIAPIKGNESEQGKQFLINFLRVSYRLIFYRVIVCDSLTEYLLMPFQPENCELVIFSQFFVKRNNKELRAF